MSDTRRLREDRQALLEASTCIDMASRHLLGDSDVNREDAGAALIEARKLIRAALDRLDSDEKADGPPR